MSEGPAIRATSLTQFVHNAALVLLGYQPSRPLPSLAADLVGKRALFDGVVDLAILPETADSADMMDSVMRICADLGIQLDRRSLCRRVACGISAGVIEPLYGCRTIAEVASGSDDLGDARVFAVLLDERRQYPDDEGVMSNILRAALEFGEIGRILPIEIGDRAAH